MANSIINATTDGLQSTGGDAETLVIQTGGNTAITVNSTQAVVLANALPVASGGTGSNTATFSGANITSINANNVSTGILAVAQGGTGASTLTSEAVIIGNTTSSVKFVSPGTAGNVLTSNGTVWASTAPAGTGANTQSFTSSGTWTKPSGCTMVMVLCWGGGGSGGRDTAGGGGGGGGGGELTSIIIPAVLLPGTVSVTIGAGGTSPATNVSGNQGGSTTFGTYSDAVGGFGGEGGSSSGSRGGPGGGRFLCGGIYDGVSTNYTVVSCGLGGIAGNSASAAGAGYKGSAGSPPLIRSDNGISQLFGVAFFNNQTAGTVSFGPPTGAALKAYAYSTQLPFTNLYSYGGGGGGGSNASSGLGGAGSDGLLAGAGGGGGSDLGTGGTGGTSSQITSFSTFTSVGGNGASNGGVGGNGSGISAGGGGAEATTAGSGSNGACVVYAW